MIVGAVADILEDMAAGRERRFADPVGAFGAHLRVALGRRIDQLRHVVAADSGIGARPFRHDGRCVVRAAGAEIEAARGDIMPRAEYCLGLPQTRDIPARVVRPAFARATRSPIASAMMFESSAAFDGKQPASLLVMLADDRRRVRGAVEDFANLGLDQAPLLLDDDDRLEALGEAADRLRFERPGARDLQEPDAEIGRPHFVDAEIVERLQHVEIALAGGRDPDPRRPSAGKHDPVGRIDADEGRAPPEACARAAAPPARPGDPSAGCSDRRAAWETRPG